MDSVKIGKLISALRRGTGMTQKDLAEKVGVSNKTVSKWECGLGCPDLSLWADLSALLGVDMVQLLEGEITQNKPDNGNIARVRFYVCPGCGNILFSTGGTSIFCCGKKLEPLVPAETPAEKIALSVTEADTDYFITFDHPMEKDHFLSFAAHVKGDRLLLIRLYPEQGREFRLPATRGGSLYLYCVNHGLTVYPEVFKREKRQ